MIFGWFEKFMQGLKFFDCIEFWIYSSKLCSYWTYYNITDKPFVLTVKTTYYNFGAAIWSNQLMGTPRTGHLVDGLEMYWSYVIFTMICFQKYFIDLCIPSLLFWKPWRRNNQVVLSNNWSYF